MSFKMSGPDFDDLIFDKEAWKEFYFGGKDLCSKRLPKINEDGDLSETSTDSSEVDIAPILAANTRPFYIDHHLQTAVAEEEKQLQKLNRLRSFKER